MFVSDIVKFKGGSIISVDPEDPIDAAIREMVTHRIGAVLVVDQQGQIAGILSERDLVRALQRHGRALFDKKVQDLMTTPVITCSLGDPVAAIEGMMTANRFRHVPVVEQGKLVGIISIGDVVKNRIEEAQSEVDALRRYIAL